MQIQWIEREMRETLIDGNIKNGEERRKEIAIKGIALQKRF
jgi:hypothetical protein